MKKALVAILIVVAIAFSLGGIIELLEYTFSVIVQDAVSHTGGADKLRGR